MGWSSAIVFMSDADEILDASLVRTLMTRVTTALMFASPRSIGPWGDRAWRLALHASLVEGGAAAYWTATPTTPAQHEVSSSEVEVEMPDMDGVIDATVLLLASHLGDEQVEALLIESHLLSIQDGVRTIARYWELFPDTRAQICELLSAQVRVGITLLEDLCLIDVEVINALRQLGFDVDLFVPETIMAN